MYVTYEPQSFQVASAFFAALLVFCSDYCCFALLVPSKNLTTKCEVTRTVHGEATVWLGSGINYSVWFDALCVLIGTLHTAAG